MPRTPLILTLLVAIGAVPAGWWLLHTPLRPGVRAEPRDVVELLVATGRVAAHRTSDLGFEVGGVLADRLVEEGDVVASGQPLARLDGTEIAAQVARAEATAAVAERELDRVRRPALAEDLERMRASIAATQATIVQAQLDLERLTRIGDVASAADRDAAATRLAQARANGQQAAAELALLQRQPLAEEVALAEAQVAETRAELVHTQAMASRRELRAPFAGVVLARFADPGVAVPVGSPVLRLAEAGRPEILVDTDEGNLGRLALGQQASITAQGFPGRSFSATLDRIGPGVDNKRGVVPLRLRAAAVPEWVRLDMTVDVSIETVRLSAVVTVPPTAVVEAAGSAYVVDTVDGVARQLPVIIRARGRDGVAVDGLTAGTVVAREAAGIAAGQRLRLREP